MVLVNFTILHIPATSLPYTIFYISLFRGILVDTTALVIYDLRKSNSEHSTWVVAIKRRHNIAFMAQRLFVDMH
jgi:hypothetical protein